MIAQIEFLPNENGLSQTIFVSADEIERSNGWIIAWKGERVVAFANEKYVKYCFLYEDEK